MIQCHGESDRTLKDCGPQKLTMWLCAKQAPAIGS